MRTNSIAAFSGALLICAGAFADSNRIFYGVVVRKNGEPVVGAPVVLYENLARRWTWFPKADREIAKAVTNTKGEFAISTSDAVNAKRLMLVVKSEWREIKISKGNYAVINNDGYLFKVWTDRVNVITVNSDYAPKNARTNFDKRVNPPFFR